MTTEEVVKNTKAAVAETSHVITEAAAEKKKIEITSLDMAMLMVQTKITSIGKSMRNEHAKYDYANLSDMLVVLRPLWNMVGMIVKQELIPKPSDSPWPEPVTMLLQTTCIHVKSKEVYVTHTPMYVGGRGTAMQELGSAQTYAQKYALRGLFMPDFEVDDDDDGAGQPLNKNNSQNFQQKTYPPRYPPEQHAIDSPDDEMANTPTRPVRGAR